MRVQNRFGVPVNIEKVTPRPREERFRKGNTVMLTCDAMNLLDRFPFYHPISGVVMHNQHGENVGVRFNGQKSTVYYHASFFWKTNVHRKKRPK